LLLAVRTEQQGRTAAALLESRCQYQSIVEDQTEMICRFRSDGTCTFANRAFCDAFGRTRDELLGHDLWSLVPAEVRPSLGALTRASPIATREVNVGACWQQWRDRGVFDDTGGAIEYQAVGRDITDRKRAEDDRRELEARKHVEATLRDADRRKDEFLAVLGHELRNPLAPLAIATKVLSEAHPDTPAASWARESAKRQLDHMTRLLDDLLDISRITLGRIELRLAWFDLRSAIDDAVEVVHAAIESRGHRLAIAVPPTPMPVRADRVRVTQVVANLLGNAAKYTEVGGRIEVTVARGQHGIRISVRDDGIGLALESLEKIFEPFHQLPATGDRVHEGLGIGLTLVRRLVELHGGTVEARSDGLRRGSEMIVYLPQVDDEVAAIAPSAVGVDGRSLRILAVDDNIDLAEGLAAVLDLWGHTVRTANDGVQALEIATAFAPEVVLLDLALPRIDGFEVARRLRAADRPAVLVAMSGYGVEPTRARVSEAGFHHHIAKPIDLDSLRALLDRAKR
jgi:PAS domain S-box-containing protein